MKQLFAALKLLVPLGLFAFLLWNVDAKDYQAFWHQSKRWHLLGLAQLIALLAFVISFLRWRLIVIAFDIPFTLRETLRLGFLGHLLNFVSFGSVGGDLFKAILVARDKPQRRPEAVASVLLDRAVGLLGLIALAWLSIQLFGQQPLPALLVGLRNAAGFITLSAIVALLIVIYAGNWVDQLAKHLMRFPFVGESLYRMVQAIRLLRRKPTVIPAMLMMSIVVQCLLSLSVYLISQGVYIDAPSLREHMMVVPPAMAAGALPIAPGGLGIQEGALAGLFTLLPTLPEAFSGMLVATVYRLVTIAIAGVGVLYYLASHGREFTFAKSFSQ